MRRLVMVAIAVLLVAVAVPASAGPGEQVSQTSGPWEWRNPLPQGNDLSAVDFAADGLHGVAVGNRGVLMYTSDGGGTWSLGDYYGMGSLNTVFVLDATHAWAVGGPGLVVFSGDGGATWTQQTSNTVRQLSGVNFFSATVGWACGDNGTIIATTNGGATWTPQTSGTIEYLTSVSAISSSRAWVCGSNGLIRRTIDGGANWSPQTSGTSEHLESISCVDENNGWACGGGAVMLHTSNGGSTWVPQDPDLATYLMDVEFTNAQDGWVVGVFGVSHTTNGGTTWDSVPVPSAAVLWDVAAVNETSVFVLQSEPGDIFFTDDSGVNWDRQQEGSTAWLGSADFGSNDVGWVVGTAGAVLKTPDGGMTWTPQTSATANGLYSVSAFDAQHAWATGGNVIIRTSDGGLTWIPKTMTAFLTSIDFWTATEGWVVGSSSAVFHTTDGGLNWDPSATGLPAGIDLQAVDFYNDDSGIAVGDDGEAYYTTNGGGNWFAATGGVPTSHNFTGVTMVSPIEAWAVCNYGNADARILHTMNGGDTWETHSRAGEYNDVWLDITFADSYNGWITGMGGRMLVTHDAGVTWEDVTTPTNVDLGAVAARGSGRVVAAGHAGAILLRRTTVNRVSGSDRYATAIAVSESHFETATTVLVATGVTFPDALSASGLAGALDAPLLLVRPSLPLPAGLLDEIERLRATEAIVIGGTNAVSADVLDALADEGLDVQRIGGVDRYDTARKIAEEVEDASPADVTFAFIARGDAFPDALACSPIAYNREIPVLLVRPGELPAATSEALTDLEIKLAVIAGGTGAVSDATKARVDAKLLANGGIATERWFGPDRYATAVEIVMRSVPRGWANNNFTGIATGKNFPDALGGGVATGAEGGVLLLTDPAGLPGTVTGYWDMHGAQVGDLEVFGGTAAVPDAVKDEIADRLR